MFRGPGRDRWTVIDTLSYLFIGSVAGRMLPYYLPTTERWVVLGLLALYLVLFTAVHIISRRHPITLYPYFVIQLVITLILCLVIPSYDGPQDYFAMLLLPLCFQAMWRLPRKIGTIWVGVFAFTMAASMIVYYQGNEQSLEGVGYGLAYVAACIMIALLSSVTLRAEEARNQTQALNNELQIANEKLQAYSQQVEQMAAVEERARLARDLHDSVSQTIFSMTLTAQAARILLERDPPRVVGQLDHLQALANNAMLEMRSLIHHMRPDGRAIVPEGLAACLRQHIMERKTQDGLIVDLSIRGDRRLPQVVEEGLFRVVQEALNNVVKHAGVSSANVTVCLDQNPITICIEDQGAGFEPAAMQSTVGSSGGHLGLAGMAERVRAIGGKLVIESAPGRGTRVWVQDLMVEEGEHAG
jgi:signal transduction histidine kinase